MQDGTYAVTLTVSETQLERCRVRNRQPQVNVARNHSHVCVRNRRDKEKWKMIQLLPNGNDAENADQNAGKGRKKQKTQEGKHAEKKPQEILPPAKGQLGEISTGDV